MCNYNRYIFILKIGKESTFRRNERNQAILYLFPPTYQAVLVGNARLFNCEYGVPKSVQSLERTSMQTTWNSSGSKLEIYLLSVWAQMDEMFFLSCGDLLEKYLSVDLKRKITCSLS